MKHFVIKYQFAGGAMADWHGEIARFISLPRSMLTRS
jgi:hypothetical protein